MLEAETGLQRGVFAAQGDFNPPFYWSPVTVGDGLAFVGFGSPASEAAALYAFDPETGQQQWSYPADALIIPAPTYADGFVYFGSDDGVVHAVDVETRQSKPGWSFKAEEGDWETAIWASPLVEGDRVYIAAMDHHLYCLDSETSEVLWAYKAGGALAAQPTLDEERGVIYVGSFDGRVNAVDVDTGEAIDGFDFKAENWIWSKVLVEEDRLYVTSLDGKLYALDPVSGEVIPPYPYNSEQASGSQDALRADPLGSGDSVIVAARSGRVISTLEAQQRWVWPTGVPQAELLTTPVISSDGTLFVLLMNGQIQALEAESGVQGWTFAPPEN
jgi:outer membrane protein assembly factor BamB